MKTVTTRQKSHRFDDCTITDCFYPRAAPHMEESDGVISSGALTHALEAVVLACCEIPFDLLTVV